MAGELTFFLTSQWGKGVGIPVPVPTETDPCLTCVEAQWAMCYVTTDLTDNSLCTRKMFFFTMVRKRQTNNATLFTIRKEKDWYATGPCMPNID